MTTLKRTARETGLAYAGLAVTGMIGMLLIRSQLYVEGDAATTAANLVQHEGLARVGIAVDLGAVLTQALAALWFAKLFRVVEPFAAAAIAAFGLVNSVMMLVGAVFSATALEVALDGTATTTGDRAGTTRFALVIDTVACARHAGCRACIDACHAAHNVPVLADPRHRVEWVREEPFEQALAESVSEYADAARRPPLPVLCNHCASPPCVRVCPTEATFKRDDGIVAMDEHRCIGCRYCMAACPYDARSFNWCDPRPSIPSIRRDFPTREKGVVEKCTFCAERLGSGRPPACVEACSAGAMVFGDVRDAQGDVARLLRERTALRRKPSAHTAPHVFYLV
jgi:molybdopterin-containing oxidoreductase family iron-sulfur binding subunit